MVLEIFAPFEAQPLDDDGDPIGDVVTLPAGRYRILSRMYRDTDDAPGVGRAWVTPADGEDAIYEARGLAVQ